MVWPFLSRLHWFHRASIRYIRFCTAQLRSINRFQRVPNALARVVTDQRPYASPLSSTALLQNLHWLPIEWRVHFKLATLAYKALHTGQPPYLSELLQHYEPTRALRSSSSFQLSVLRYTFCIYRFPISKSKWIVIAFTFVNKSAHCYICRSLS